MKSTPSPQRLFDTLMYRDCYIPAALSFEFFPPKYAADFEAPLKAVQRLANFHPRFFSVTYGAGGSTRDNTFALATQIQTATKIGTAAHITCVGQPKEELRALAYRYKKAGIRRYVALRGDMPELGAPFVQHPNGFSHSVKLVEALKEIDPECEIHVAAFPETHPEAVSSESDIGYLKEKLDAGADGAITQYCYDTAAMLRFIERCRAAGITKPIIPGIMPIRNIVSVKRFSSRCGASVPQALTSLFENSSDNATVLKNAACYIAVEQGLTLIREGAAEHLHLYCMNKAELIEDICALLQHNHPI